MDTKEKIVKDWLSRYTGKSLDSFGEYILLTNFQKYVIQFSEIMNSTIEGESSMMGSSTAENITIINDVIRAISRPEYRSRTKA